MTVIAFLIARTHRFEVEEGLAEPLPCRLQRLEAIAPRGESNDGQIERRNVLLKLDTPVHGDENVEVAFGSLEQLSVLQPGPPDFRDRTDIMPWQLILELPGQTLIEEDAHGK